MVKAVVGANWGDEGKGKITDMLAGNADIVVRFQGGANAGHTIKNKYGKFALHTLPSGVFNDGVINCIGNGVALDVDKLLKEYNGVIEKGVPAPRLMVSERCQMVMPYHVLFDVYEEERLGKASFGSTKSGIAPFYSDKYAKIGFQVCELFDEKALREKLERVLEVKNILIENLYQKEPLSVDEILSKMMEWKKGIEPFVGDVRKLVYEADKAGKTVLLEGQLGTLKDTDHGIYPMVTSSNTIAGYGAVGAGAFVSEIFGDEAKAMRDHGGDGGEYGATTGRPRRMGWFDCVATRYGCEVQGTTHAVLTVVDALSYLDEIKVCVAYEIDGKVTKDFPVTGLLEKAKPVLVTLPGWKCDITGIKNYSELPENCRAYIEFIEKEIGFKIVMVSNGPARENIIIKN